MRATVDYPRWDVQVNGLAINVGIVIIDKHSYVIASPVNLDRLPRTIPLYCRTEILEDSAQGHEQPTTLLDSLDGDFLGRGNYRADQQDHDYTRHEY